MARVNDWNERVIAEFRENGGRVRAFAHQPLLLLHHRGAKTGIERVNPLARQDLEDGWAVFASKGGSPTNPDWLANLIANPEAKVEIGDRTFDVVAQVAEGAERERIWEEQKRRNPAFAEYELKSPRKIPVVILRWAGRDSG